MIQLSPEGDVEIAMAYGLHVAFGSAAALPLFHETLIDGAKVWPLSPHIVW